MFSQRSIMIGVIILIVGCLVMYGCSSTSIKEGFGLKGAVVRGNVITYNGNDYQTITGQNPMPQFPCSNVNCENNTSQTIPKGWTVANDNQDSIDIIKSYPWSTNALVVSSGNSYWSGWSGSSACDNGTRAGTQVAGAGGELSTNGGITGGDKAWVTTCNQLLLLSRPTSSNNKYPTYQAGWNLLPGATVSGHIVTYKGMDYQTITGLDPYGPGSRPEETSTICESTPAAIPDGWGLAEDNAATIDVIKTFPWSSQYAVVKDGAQYGTNLSNAGNRYATTGAIRNSYGNDGKLTKAWVASGSCNSVVLLSRQSAGGGNNNDGGGGTKCQKNWYWNSGDGQCTQHCPLHSQTRNSARQCICESGGSNVTCIEGTHCVNNACVDGNPSPRVFISGHLIGSQSDHTMHLWTPYAPGIAGGTINGPTEITNTAASPAFQNAQNNTFNSILIDKDTTFTMYSGENGTGKSWTRTGPILLWGGDNSAQMDEWEQIGGSATVGDQTAWNGKLDTSFYEESTLPPGCMLETMGDDWCCISSGGSFQISTPQGGSGTKCPAACRNCSGAQLSSENVPLVNGVCTNFCSNADKYPPNGYCGVNSYFQPGNGGVDCRGCATPPPPQNACVPGLDVASGAQQESSIEACQQSCQEDSDCTWWSYYPQYVNGRNTSSATAYSGDCYTSSSSATTVAQLVSDDPGTVSGRWYSIGGSKNCAPLGASTSPPPQNACVPGLDILSEGPGTYAPSAAACQQLCQGDSNCNWWSHYYNTVTRDDISQAGGNGGPGGCYLRDQKIESGADGNPNVTIGGSKNCVLGAGGGGNRGGNRGGNGGWQNNDGELSVGQGAVYVNVDGNSYEECYGNSCCSIYGGCCQACNTWCDGYWCGNYNNNPTGFSSIDLGDDSVYVNVAN